MVARRLFYCPRCDRSYETPELTQEHLEKHPDFDPTIFGEHPKEEDND